MASIYKTLLGDDVANSRTLLHEAIPITGSIVSQSYAEPGSAGSNVKQYAHGMFNSVYDYPYLSSSANHIFDMTVGTNASYTGYGSITNQKNKKTNIYNQMAQVLMGHDVTGSILAFDADGDITGGGTKYNDAVFLNFSRLLTKDEIKKGTFELQMVTDPTWAAPATTGTTSLTIKDEGAASDYRVNSPAGEYGILKVTGLTTGAGLAVTPTDVSVDYTPSCGLIFYQAGVAVLSTDIFRVYGGGASLGKVHPGAGADIDLTPTAGTQTIDNVLQGETIETANTGLRNRLTKICFNNTTELNSTIYFCRANHNDFNYSSNPTYLKDSKIRVKSKTTDAPVSYITTVGLYSADNELLAVAKLSEPLRKDPTNDISLRVRLDY
jgi:hypothetical protein